MKTGAKVSIVIGLLVVIGITMAIKQKQKAGAVSSAADARSRTASSQPAGATVPADRGPLPRLVDLGAGKCIPCKKMAPILEELKKEFAGRLVVEFIDVWQNPNAGDLYGVQMIPTQIFYDAADKELYRHEGFFSREDILGKWKELGVDLAGRATPVEAGK